MKRISVVDVNRYPYILSRMFSISMDEMRKWLMNYERLRLDPSTPNESWVSSKYPIQDMHWRELQQIYLPELNMNWGQACSSLKKSWQAYKAAGRNGMYRTDIAWRINAIQKAMGIEKSEFLELEGIETNDEQITDEEIQLKREEREAAGDWGFGKPEESYTEE
jgi:hypothetical protein